jgi:hypothetical protein
VRRYVEKLRLVLCVGFLLGSGGCAGGGVPLEEVSDQPIAFVYWDAATARRRGELLEELTADPQSGSGKRGVARLDDVADLVTPTERRSAQSLRLREFPGRLVLFEPRSGAITPIEGAPPNSRPLAWSPDRSLLLFNSAHLDGGTTQLYQYHLETGEGRKLTHGPAHHPEGTYAPDGSLAVAWIRIDRGKQMAGLDIRPKGGGVGERVLEGLYPSSVQWSPKGDSLLYVYADNRPEARTDRSEIVIQPAEPDMEPDRLARGREAVFSPDGESIVYATQSGKTWRLARIRPDGSGHRTLGLASHNQRSPAVSPDGQHVVYLAKQGNVDHLFLRRMDGTGDRILLREGSVAFPVW